MMIKACTDVRPPALSTPSHQILLAEARPKNVSNVAGTVHFKNHSELRLFLEGSHFHNHLALEFESFQSRA